MNLYMFSLGLGGAEKRISAIAYSMAQREIVTAFCINKTLFRRLKLKENLVPMLSYMEKNGIIYLAPDVGSNTIFHKLISQVLMLWYGVLLIFKKRKENTHLVLGAIYLAGFAGVFSNKVSMEVTSPDYAKRIVRNNLMYKMVDAFICVSPTVYKAMGALDKSSKYCLSLPYAENKNYHCTDIKKDIDITYCSRFIERKNPILAAKAIVSLLDDMPELKVCFLGEGPLNDDVYSILEEKVNIGSVFFGFVDLPVVYMQRTRVFLSLIEPDNYPSQSVIEAMAAENYLVLSKTGDSNKFIFSENGYANGVLCRLTIQDIKREVKAVLNDSARLEDGARLSRKHLEVNFNSEKYFQEVATLFGMIIND